MAYIFQSVFASEFKNFLIMIQDAGQQTRGYEATFKSLDIFISENPVHGKALTEETISRWLDSLSCKPQSKNRRITHVRVFSRYLNALEIPAFEPGYMREQSEYIPYTFTDEEFRAIIHAADEFLGNRRGSTKSSRAFPMLLRIVTIPQNCTVLLKGYMKSRGFCSNDPGIQNRHLFSSRTNEHMSISCVEGIVRKYLVACRQEHPDKFLEKGYSPHSFRHSIAVHMLEAGDSLVTIKAFLGHASIVTTTIYAQVTPELANKYLDERGKPIPEKNVEASPKPLAQALPFLYK